MNILRTLVHKGTAVLMSIAIVLSVAQPVSAKSSSADDFFKAKDPFSDIFSSESSTSSTSEQIQVPEPPQGFEDVVRTNSEFKNPFYDTDPKTLQGLAAAYAYHVLNAVGGYSDGSFRGDEILNRAGLAKIILIARYGLIKDDDSKKNNGRFGDMLEKEWYRPYMMMAVLKGILRGYPDGTMRPAAPITTAEATKIAVETFNLPKNLPYDYLDVFSYDWFAPYAGAAQAYNFFPLRNSPQYFEPQRLVTRFGLVVMIYQILKGENTVPTPEPLPPIPQPLPPVPMPSTDDYVLNGTMTVGTNDYSNPEDIAITPDGKTAVVSLVGDGTLEYIDISPSSPGGPHTVREIHSGSSTETEESPTGIAIIPDSTKILVAETIGDFVLVMNSSNLIVERAISTEGESSSNPEDIAITPDGTKALVTLPGEGAVGVFTPSAYRLDRKIQVGGTPTGIAITPDGKKALVADNSSEQILVLNLSDYSVSKRISVGKNPFSNPEDIAIAPDGKRAFVTLVGDGNVEVIDLESSSVVRTINVGGSPTGITVAPNGKKIYVANNQTEKIQIIDVVPSTQPLPPIPVPPNECTLNVLSDMNETVEETGRKAVSPWMHPTWTASIPGAKWIWKSELVEDPTDEETYTFTKNFSWTQSVYSATLKIAADNSYEVWLNGTLVGADASENNFQIGTQDSYNVAPALVNGTNTLKIRVKNLSGFADPYSNPAGLLYSLNIQASNCGGGGGYPIPEPLILKARLSPDTPPSQEFPADVVNVPVLKIQLTASSSEALHISDVGITDNGNGKIQDAGLVKIFDGDNKLGVSSGDYDGNLVWIHLSPRFDIPAGTTKTMTVGIERHAWNTYNGNNSKNKKNHIFSLHAANHISAKGDSGRRAIVLGQFPIKGNKMTFGKTPDQGNSYPIISAFSGPEYLKVGEIGEWKITARDPKNGPLTYSVTWGDEGDFLARPSTSEIMASFNQTVTLTHSYQKAGKYNPRFVVTNNAGLTAETTVEVKVGILSPNNLPPVISGISAPTVLQVGQEGTLKVTASDPENGPLTYTVVWGDEPIQIQPYLVNQTATFSHTYSRAGTYTPTVTVTDDHGLSAKTSATLTVTPQGPTTGKEPVNVNLNTETMSSTAAVGQKDVCFLEFNLFAGATTETRVTDISTNGYIDENGDGGFQQGTDNNVNLKDIVQAVKLIDSSSKQVITTESVPSFGTVVFDNVNILISKGTHRAFKICGDISVNAYLNNTPEKVAFTIPLLSITAQNSDGNTLSQTGTANTNYSTVITVVASSSASGGALTLSVSPSTPQEGILFPGDVKKLVSKYKFSAAGEGFVVRKLAVNNFQSGVTDADLAEYDNNVKSVTISYLNSQGQTEEKTSYVSQGNALFSGLNIAVPKDGTADLSVFVNVNTVLLGATPGEFLRLDLAFNQFEAMGTTSGEIFRAYRMDADFLSSADFDFGEMRWMNSGVSVQGTDTTGSNTLGETTSFNVQPGVLLPIGTLICVDDNSSGTCDAEDIYVVESWVNEGDTVTTTLLDDAGDGVYANNAGDNILYALPGDGYLITTNQMQIGASTPTLALDPNSPRGPRTPLSGDTTFIFDVRAANSGDIHITPGTELIASDGYDGNGNNNLPLGSSVETGKRLDGLSMTEPLMNFTSGDTISFEPTQQSTSQYKRIAFWMMWSDAAGTLQPTFTDLKLETASSSTGQPTNGTSLSQLICGADQSNLVSGEWYFCDLDLPGNDRYVHLELDDMTEFSTADTLYFDVMRLYNEKIVVDIASDGDLDTYAHNISNPGSPVSALLALSGTNFSADGYISTKTNGASATTEASVTFIPTNLNPLLNFASGTTTVLAVQTDTASLLHEDAGEADMLTFSIAYGRSVDGNVVAGGFWYNDGYNTIKWLGNTEGSRLIGNTLEY